ncbi:MAG: type III pantothenate kinase [Kiritimatiellia bacterium]|nr:type III pantothenate kinase [Kiritimatiellia bacterium]
MKRTPNPTAVLVISIGNTRTAVTRVVGDRVGRVFRRPTDACGGPVCEEMIREALGGRPVVGAVIGSTAPSRVKNWQRAWRNREGDALIVTPALDPGLPMSYPGRKTLGADRLADLCGGAARYGLPLIVVDVGTAMTVNVMTKPKGFIGGLILPGPDLFLRVLSDGTALLPRLSSDIPPRRRAFGRTTEESMRLGASLGCAALLEGLVRRLRRQLRQPDLPVVITGGGARRLRPVFDPPARFDPTLTLFGLARLFELHRAG